MDIESYPVEDHLLKYLTDESGLITGFADEIFFPKSTDEVQILMKNSFDNKIPITISGGGTGLDGGRAPLGGRILATDKLLQIDEVDQLWLNDETGIEYGIRLENSDNTSLLTVPVSMTVKAIQNFVRENQLFYPPDPTERSSFIGGNVVTNASGSRSFKYGVTRDWVVSLKIVLPNGEKIMVARGGGKISDVIILKTNNSLFKIPRPTYKSARSRKNVAGPVLDDESELIDLFIGTGGIFGTVTEVTLRLISIPANIMNIFVYCQSELVARKIVDISRENRNSAVEPIPLSVEFLDKQAVEFIRQKEPSIPQAEVLIILEQDYDDNEEESFLMYWYNIFESLGVETSVAQTFKEIEHHKNLRHAVPETVNALVKSHGQPKLGTDYAVPDENFEAIMEYCVLKGNEFEDKFNFKPGYAIWAHAGDSHFHQNFLPRNEEQTLFAKDLMIDIMKKVVKYEGSIAAEHGVGKKSFRGIPALVFQYGEDALKQIKAMKSVLDPNNLLNRGNLIPIDV